MTLIPIKELQNKRVISLRCVGLPSHSTRTKHALADKFLGALYKSTALAPLHHLHSTRLQAHSKHISCTLVRSFNIPSSMASTTTTTTIEDLNTDVLTRALSLLDGPALASASCATTHLRSLSSQPDQWRYLCFSTWPSLADPNLLHLIPSFPNSYRSYFADAYSFPSLPCRQKACPTDDVKLPRELISAVDVYHKGMPIFSRVVETETSTTWFHSSPFRIDALDRKDPPSTPRAVTEATTIESVISPAELTLSWVVIDPVGKRAVNISSQKPVAVDRHWYTGEKLVRFAMVLNDWCSLGAVVTCEEETGQVREVSMTVEDMDGTCLNGKDSLRVLRGLMEGGRRGRRRDEEAAAAKERYRDYLRRKRERKDKKARIEGRLDMLCAAIGASAFLALCLLFVFK